MPSRGFVDFAAYYVLTRMVFDNFSPSGPQRQVLYSASKGVNSSAGLCFLPTEMTSFP